MGEQVSAGKKLIRIFSWNVNGLRAVQNKGFHRWIKKAGPDILCLQETKASEDQLDDSLIKIDDYLSYFASAERKGYSGVAIYTKIKPDAVNIGFGNPGFDAEGRVIEADFKDFMLYNVYFPNSGMGPERLKFKLDFYDSLFFYIEKIRKKRSKIIICGDYNTAHKEIDLARPKDNENSPGFMPVEREWIDKVINLGYVDIFREFSKEAGQYTYWDYFRRSRERNIGWRIDYFFVSKEIKDMVKNTRIHKDVMGSDHCPIELEIS